jgi:hypothetical protein
MTAARFIGDKKLSYEEQVRLTLEAGVSVILYTVQRERVDKLINELFIVFSDLYETDFRAVINAAYYRNLAGKKVLN